MEVQNASEIKADKTNQVGNDDEDGSMLRRMATDKFNANDPI